MSNIPWRCKTCGAENLIDLLDLKVQPVDKIHSARGFSCQKCGTWEAVSYTSPTLQEAERKLSRYVPGQRQFAWLFGKLMKKAAGMTERMASQDVRSPGT